MEKQRKTAVNNFGVRGWLLILYAFLIFFVSSCVPQQMFNSTGTYYTDVMGWNNVLLQGMLTIAGLFANVMILFTGQMSMKGSARKFAIILGIIWPICAMMMGFSKGLAVFLVFVVITRCCGDAIAFSSNGILMANWFPKKRGLAMGWATFGFPMAGGLGMMLISKCFAAIGSIWGAYLPIVILELISLFILIAFLKDTPEECGCYPDNDKNATYTGAEMVPNPSAAVTEWTTKKCFTTKEFWLVAFSIGCMMFAAGYMTQVGAAIMSLGYPPTMIGPVMMGVMVVCCAGSYICGLMDVKLGTRKAIIITDCLLLLMGVTAQFNHIGLFFISLACMSMALGGGSNYLVSWVSAIWGRKNFKAVYRWAIFFTNTCAVLAAVIIASIANATTFKIAYLFGSCIALVGLILSLCVKKDVDYTK